MFNKENTMHSKWNGNKLDWLHIGGIPVLLKSEKDEKWSFWGYFKPGQGIFLCDTASETLISACRDHHTTTILPTTDIIIGLFNLVEEAIDKKEGNHVCLHFNSVLVESDIKTAKCPTCSEVVESRLVFGNLLEHLSTLNEKVWEVQNEGK